jgi:uncharacterized protein YciI
MSSVYLALIYDLAGDYFVRRPKFRDEHLAQLRAAHERGELVLAGAFDEPMDHALLIWNVEDDSTVRRFIDADPYVENGLVSGWSIRHWNVVVGDAAR